MRKIVIIGGGAAGFFAALAAAEKAKANRERIDVCILESSDSLLKKVKISGGGRCNVTHNCFDVLKFCENYPRGQKELISVMKRFQAADTVQWFLKRGVRLVAESDGRMFPDTDSSQTIIDCFMHEAERLNVHILKGHSVVSIKRDQSFLIALKDRPEIQADSVMIATGSSPAGYRLAQELGHSISELAPSLFSFKISDPLISNLEGVSFENTQVSLVLEKSNVFKQRGPILITHWGLSGPAILKLSAWAAREMKHSGYKGALLVNWFSAQDKSEVEARLREIKNNNLKSQVSNVYPDQLTKRFWLKILSQCDISEKRWAELSNKELSRISEMLFSSRLSVLGKNRFKDEFVECGGVNLKEIDFKTMESKLTPGLFFAGEVLDIDGITGGFNFQNAWSGGWVAGQNI